MFQELRIIYILPSVKPIPTLHLSICLSIHPSATLHSLQNINKKPLIVLLLQQFNSNAYILLENAVKVKPYYFSLKPFALVLLLFWSVTEIMMTIIQDALHCRHSIGICNNKNRNELFGACVSWFLYVQIRCYQFDLTSKLT